MTGWWRRAGRSVQGGYRFLAITFLGPAGKLGNHRGIVRARGLRAALRPALRDGRLTPVRVLREVSLLMR